MIADDGEEGGEVSKPCYGRDIPVDAREASVAKKRFALFGEKVMVGIANWHAVAKENSKRWG